MVKTNRHKRRLEDSEDLFDRRKKNRGKGTGRKHSKSNVKRWKRIQESMGGFESFREEQEWED